MQVHASGDGLVKVTTLCAVIMLALPLRAKQKKPTGEVTDRAAFTKIESYCVDLSGLEDYESYDVRGFIEQESQPGKLLTKIPWKFETNCRESDADADVKLEFPRLRVARLGSAPPTPGTDGQAPPVVIGGSEPLYHTVAVLRVVSRQTSRAVYTCQADPLSPEGSDTGPVGAADTVQRWNATYRAFWTLAQDIERLSP